METVIWIIMIIMFCYTVGFSITLWKQKSRIGAFAVFVLAVAVIITPFFSALR